MIRPAAVKTSGFPVSDVDASARRKKDPLNRHVADEVAVGDQQPAKIRLMFLAGRRRAM